jgi:hypothetical protein
LPTGFARSDGFGAGFGFSMMLLIHSPLTDDPAYKLIGVPNKPNGDRTQP